MPAPTKDELARLTKMLFLSRGINLPGDWQAPGGQFPDAFDASELAVAPNSPLTLFREPTLNKYHVDAANKIGKQFEDYIDGICDAICTAVDTWLKMAMITTALINGPVGVVPPSSVVGPVLTSLISGKGPKKTPMELKYTQAVATALGLNWQAWQSGLMGVLMYPAFTAFPGPMAPPTPNVPIPLMAFGSPAETLLSPTTLSATMQGFFADPTAVHHIDLFDALANAFNIVFQKFKLSTLVQNVLGMGPIPSFAPPFVPVGPVVGGAVIPKPGVLS
jgi:hypothetical protein